MRPVVFTKTNVFFTRCYILIKMGNTKNLFRDTKNNNKKMVKTRKY